MSGVPLFCYVRMPASHANAGARVGMADSRDGPCSLDRAPARANTYSARYMASSGGWKRMSTTARKNSMMTANMTTRAILSLS